MSNDARLDALEARVSRLEAGSAPASSADTLPFEKLRESWADKQIGKLPSNWKGRDVVGMSYSDLTAEEARDLAGFHQWKCDKAKTENPPRLQTSGKNAGKPWWEVDAFTAKLLRTWSAYREQAPTKPQRQAAAPYGRSGAQASAKHTMPPEPPDAEFEDGGDLPF